MQRSVLRWICSYVLYSMRKVWPQKCITSERFAKHLFCNTNCTGETNQSYHEQIEEMWKLCELFLYFLW